MLSSFNEFRKPVSIRLKVTEKCPWNCSFCHREGGWEIDDVQWSEKTADAFAALRQMTGVREVHYTGGEPSAMKSLPELTAGLSKMGFNVKASTNGQFTEKLLKRLVKNGLTHYNFSVLSMLPDDFVKIQKSMKLETAVNALNRQEKIIKAALTLGCIVKINTVISDESDFSRALKVYHFAKKTGVTICLLNNLNNGSIAENAVKKIAETVIKGKKIETRKIPGSSSVITFYRDSDGFEFRVKGIRQNRIPSLCQGCKETCREGFYGIRMELKNGVFFVRLCIHRNDEKSVMPLAQFLQSRQLNEINNMTGFC